MKFEKILVLFKYSVYTLLAVNIYLFFRHTTFHEGVDCVGWVLLLALFEWQTRKNERVPYPRWEKVLLIACEATAYAFILYAWGNYILHGQWLDFVNATLWIAVVAMISAELYWPHGHSRRLRNTLKTALYVGLVAIAVVWGVTGDILNFYDAFLWIVCFFAIEMNLLAHVHRAWTKP